MTLQHLKEKKPEKFRNILDAAIRVFARKGFFNTRVTDVAQEAGVADGTIYLYFQNKDDILISLFEEGMRTVIETVRREVGEEQDPLRKIRRFARAHMSLIESNQDLAEVLQVELRQSAKFMKEYRNEKFYEYLDIIAAIVREGQEQGVIRPEVNPGVVKRAFFGALDEMGRFWVLSSRKKPSVMDAADQISDFFVRGLAA